jgi:DNA-binding Lrp family transcriptional regulator
VIEIAIDEHSLDAVEAFLAATPAQVDKAMASTLTKMARGLTSRSIKALAKELKLPPKEVKRRLRTFRLSRVAGGKGVRVWYGLDPMGMIHLNAKEDRGIGGGVAAYGDRFVADAFIAKGRAGNGGTAASNRQVFKRVGKTRLPIKKVTVELGDPAQTYIEDHILGGLPFTAQFFKTFEHELKWRQRSQ